jgi:ubiquinone/menaquinone biosynthesis C-methylase UbiE
MEKYSSKQYWNERYQKGQNHQWYFSYEELKPILNNILQSDDKLLEIGCGDKPTVISLQSEGHQGLIYAIDYSINIINKLNTSKLLSDNNKSIKYSCMDARNLTFPDYFFDLVLDKGTCDAMMCSNDMKVAFKNVQKIFSEMIRVLRKDKISRIICVSHICPESEEFQQLFDNCLTPALQSEPSVHWHIDSHSGSTQIQRKSRKRKYVKKETIQSAGPTVYVIQSMPRRITRVSCLSVPSPITMKIHIYDSKETIDQEE